MFLFFRRIVVMAPGVTNKRSASTDKNSSGKKASLDKTIHCVHFKIYQTMKQFPSEDMAKGYIETFADVPQLQNNVEYLSFPDEASFESRKREMLESLKQHSSSVDKASPASPPKPSTAIVAKVTPVKTPMMSDFMTGIPMWEDLSKEEGNEGNQLALINPDNSLPLLESINTNLKMEGCELHVHVWKTLPEEAIAGVIMYEFMDTSGKQVTQLWCHKSHCWESCLELDKRGLFTKFMKRHRSCVKRQSPFGSNAPKEYTIRRAGGKNLVLQEQALFAPIPKDISDDDLKKILFNEWDCIIKDDYIQQCYEAAVKLRTKSEHLIREVQPLKQNPDAQYWNKLKGSLHTIKLFKYSCLTEMFMDGDIREILKLVFPAVKNHNFYGTWKLPEYAQNFAGTGF